MNVIDSWVEQYTVEKEKLVQYQIEIKEELQSLFKDDSVIISSRIKDEISLNEKIIRNKYFLTKKKEDNIFDFLKDGMGFRIVCLEQKDEKAIHEKLLDAHQNNLIESFEFVEESIKKQPEYQKNGHQIYRINAVIKGKMFEIQIKSTTHMLWGEIEHLLFYKNYDCYIGSIYLKKQIEQIYDDLLSINKRLSDLKDYMKNNNDERSDIEIIEISMKMLQEKLKKAQLTYYHGIELDYREVYEVIINEFYYNRKEKYSRGKKKKNKINKIKHDDFSELLKSINRLREEDWYVKNVLIDFEDIDYKSEKIIAKKIIHKLERDSNRDEWIFYINVTSALQNISNDDFILQLTKRLKKGFKITLENEDELDLNHFESAIFDSLLNYLVSSQGFHMINEDFINLIRNNIVFFFDRLINISAIINSISGDGFKTLIDKSVNIIIELSRGNEIEIKETREIFKEFELYEKVKDYLSVREKQSFSFSEFYDLLRRCDDAEY